MPRDDLRRSQRMKVCCRVDVRDRLGVWSAVTEDFCARGCGIISAKLPRIGSVLELTFWSDLFPEPLDVIARTAWVSDRRVGVTFIATTPRNAGLSPAEWENRIVEHGRVPGPEPIGSEGPRVVPVLSRRSVPPSRVVEHKNAASDVPARRDGAGLHIVRFGHLP